MSTPVAPRIFISYSTRDGTEAASALRKRLEDAGFAIWQDVVALRGGRDWWSQIEETIRAPSVEHLVLVVSESSLDRPVIRQEIRLARQEAVQVTPVLGEAALNPATFPRWLGHVLNPANPEHWQVLLNTLKNPSQNDRVVMMAPEPPIDFVARPREFDALKRELIDRKGDAVIGVTAALRGAGGYGKTTLAKALAHDPDIQDAYFDGILWVELGERPDSLVGTIADLIERMTGERPGFEGLNAAATALGEALGDRRVLLVIDDAWHEQDLRPFLHGGPFTTRFVTTRIDQVLPADARRQRVDAMQIDEALALLTFGLPAEQVPAEARRLDALATRLGEWAQLLKLVNGFLRERVAKAKQPLAQALDGINKRLDEKGLAAFDARNPEDRTKAIARTIAVSLELLDEPARARFGELGIFPEDVDVPIGIVARLWGETGGLDEFETEDLLNELSGLSLLLDLDLERRTLRFHDTVRHYLQDTAGREGLVAQHKQLIQAMGDIGGIKETPVAEAQYFYLHMPHHLAGAGDRVTLDQILTDPSWLAAKLAATNSPQALMADYDRYGNTQMQSLIGRTLWLTSGILARDPRQLLPQLAGRLMGFSDNQATEFVKRARALARPQLLPLHPGLTPPGEEVMRIEGHTEAVTALAMLPNGRLASASNDRTIRVWELRSGTETVRMGGHKKAISALTVLPPGVLVSGSDDETLRLWNPTTGEEIARLEGHKGRTFALAGLPDGRLAWAGLWKGVVRILGVATGAEVMDLQGHWEPVQAFAILPDGRLVSASSDKTIRVWDTSNGVEVSRLEGHTRKVYALAVLPNGLLASGSDDNTIRIWDLVAGIEIGRLEGHTGQVNALAALADNQLASGSNDLTVRVWDLTTRAEKARLEGHSGSVTALAALSDGRLASSSVDRTVRIWEPARNPATRSSRHGREVRGLVLLSDQRLASCSGDGTIGIWDTASGVMTAELSGHEGAVYSLAVLPDGRLASGSQDKTVRFWDLTAGSEASRVMGHSTAVTALAVLPGGRLVSGSFDRVVRVWNTAIEAEVSHFGDYSTGIAALAVLRDGRLALGPRGIVVRIWDTLAGSEIRLRGHTSLITSLAVLNDGRLASGSEDRTVLVWDPMTSSNTMRIEGHTGPVTALAMLSDDRLVSGARDNTVRIWDLTRNAEIMRLELDAPVTALVALSNNRLVAGDGAGRLHWLEVIV